MNNKITIIGDVGVGKTSILNRLVHNQFAQNEMSTIGVDFNVTTINERKLQFWDTAGEERFRSISRIYYNGTKLIIIVFDVHNWKQMHTWIEEAQRISDSPIVLMGNRYLDNDDVNYTSIEKICREIAKLNKMDIFFVNAKKNIGIIKSFEKISERFPKSKIQNNTGPSRTECCYVM